MPRLEDVREPDSLAAFYLEHEFTQSPRGDIGLVLLREGDRPAGVQVSRSMHDGAACHYNAHLGYMEMLSEDYYWGVFRTTEAGRAYADKTLAPLGEW